MRPGSAPLFGGLNLILASADFTTSTFGVLTLPIGVGFARASIATISDRVNGLVTSVAVDQARVGVTSDGFIVARHEEARINRVPDSNDLAGASYTNGTQTTKTSNYGSVADPMGGHKSTRIVVTTLQYSPLLVNHPVTAGNSYAHSEWRRATSGATGRYQGVLYDLSATPVVSYQTPTTSGLTWTRGEQVHIASVVANFTWVMPLDGRDDTALGGLTAAACDHLIIYHQLEEGGWASEVIETSGGTATRAGDHYWDSRTVISAGRAGFLLTFKAPCASNQYVTTTTIPYVWKVDVNNYTKFTSASGLFDLVVGGSAFTTRVAASWVTNDLVELWFESGGGSLVTSSYYRVNSGAWIFLGASEEAQAAIVQAGNVDICSNGTASQFSVGFRRWDWYNAGRRPAGIPAPPAAVIPVEVAITDNVIGSIAPSDLTSPLFTVEPVVGGAMGVTSRRIATVGEGADGLVPCYYLNEAGDSTGGGFLSFMSVVPPGGTAVSLTFDARLPVGVGAGTIAHGFATSAFNPAYEVGSPTTTVLTQAWQTITVNFTIAAGSYTRSILKVGSAPASTQCRALIRNFKLAVDGATGNLAGGNFRRIDFDPAVLHDGGTRTNTFVGASGGGAYFANWWHQSLARMGLSIDGVTPPSSLTLEIFSTRAIPSSRAGVAQGVHRAETTYVGETTTPGASDPPAYLAVALGSGRCIDIVNGAYTGTATDITTIRAVYIPDSTLTILRAPTPTQAIICCGDSILAGFYGLPAARYTSVQQLRKLIPSTTMVHGELRGAASLNELASTGPLRTTLVAKLAGYAPTVVGADRTYYIEHAFNDWVGTGGAIWSAVDYGTALAALVDLIHAGEPLALVVLQTAITATTQANTNTFGDNLAAYRTQMNTVAAAGRSAWCKIVDGTALLTTNPTVDGIHPGNTDFTTIALNLVRALRTLNITGIGP